MGRPRKYVRVKLRRKCHQCGKMANDVFVHQIVPSFRFAFDIPTYSRKKEKIPRSAHKGDRKVKTGYYCNQDCYSESLEAPWAE